MGEASIVRHVYQAYAKLNLVLSIRGRRADGYHDIDSLMHTFSLSDRVTIKHAESLRVDCQHPQVSGGPGNIAYKAAARLRNNCRKKMQGAHIQIDKQIHVAAGLGGGSSNAGTVLAALNRLWRCGLDPAELAQIGVSVGTDVPFFVYGGAARVGGIGEIIQPVTPLSGVPIILIPFAEGLSTGDIYQAFDADSVADKADVKPALEALAAGDVVALGQALANDLESVVVRLRPEVAKARKDLLNCGAVGARMSGSGPTVFGLFAHYAQAVEAYNFLHTRWPGIGLYELCGKGVAVEC